MSRAEVMESVFFFKISSQNFNVQPAPTTGVGNEAS